MWMRNELNIYFKLTPTPQEQLPIKGTEIQSELYNVR
jgi:hypothetical protein